MKAMLEPHKKKIHSVKINQERQSESDETRINKTLTRYFVWYMNNNIEEFRICFKFWNEKFTNHSSVFFR